MAQRQSYNTVSPPLRPIASPRPTPPSSQGSLDIASPTEEPYYAQSTPSSGAQSPLRGRSLHRIPQKSRLVSRATTRRYTNLDSTQKDWEQPLVNHGLTHATSSEFDPSLLEPLPLDIFRSSLSEELHRAATFDSSIDLKTFGGHRDTFGLFQLRNIHNPFANLPPMFFAQISQYLDTESYKAMRLTCHSWSVAISSARLLRATSVVMLPAEILEQIYATLSPIDFNAARHTCRAWMRTGLEPRLLMLMLKRGGWFRTVAADLKVSASQCNNRSSSIGNDEWFLSKRLATECSVSPGWSGHGVPESQATVTGLRLTSQIDFSQLGVDASHPPTSEESGAGIGFTISTCTNFLLAYASCTIYIYALRRMPYYGSAQPYGGRIGYVTCVVCPDHVLAVSMDTSSQRYAVAALLHDSIGIVHELDLVRFSTPWTAVGHLRNRVGLHDRRQGEVLIPPPSGKQSRQESALSMQATLGTVYSSSRDTLEAVFSKTDSKTFRPRTWTLGDRSHSQQPSDTAFCAHTPLHGGSSTGSFSVYRNLCRVDDAPRSVAICPQRRCVAFGFQRGIELHWIDALTGQDLSRWFSLSDPADHLFFMPTREDADNSRKLRLVSSAATPGLSKNNFESYSSDHHGADNEKHREAAGLNFTNTFPGPATAPEYYTAVPLSDGRHLLLILPGTGELCLVKGKPQSLEAENLIRRFTFVGPTTDGGITIIPHVYTAAAELQWGVRITAAYEDQLWLFMVSPDLFFERKSPNRKSSNIEVLNEEISSTVRIVGVEIASITNLSNLTLDGSTGDLTLWAFSDDGQANIFQLAGSGRKAVQQCVAFSDGTIVSSQDRDGDTIMTDFADSRDADGDVVMADNADCRFEGRDVAMTDVSEPPEDEALKSDATMSSLRDWLLCSVPCFPSCDHRYCRLLLYLDNGTLKQTQDGTNPPGRERTGLERGSNPTTFLRPSAIMRHFSMPGSYPPLPEDEGYASEDNEELSGCRSAIYVPLMSGQWNQKEDSAWAPEYLRAYETGIEDEGLGLDLIELCRCECEIVGN